MSIVEKIALYLCLTLVVVGLFKGCGTEDTSKASEILTETFLKENKKMLDSISRERNIQDVKNLTMLKDFMGSRDVQPIVNNYKNVYETIRNTASDTGQLLLLQDLLAKHRNTPVVRD